MEETTFIRRAWIVVGVLILVAALFLISWESISVLLLFFLATLLAIFLQTLASFVGSRTHWRYGWCLVVVMGVILGVLAIAGFLLGPNAAAQITSTMDRLPEARHKLESYGWTGLLYNIPGMKALLSGQENLWSRVTESFSFGVKGFGPLVGLGAFIVIGIYLAATPGHYVDGAVSLCPPRRRSDMRKVLDEIGNTLRWWLLGQVGGMALIAVGVSIGLRLLGMPLSFTLGIFAGLMAFIPNIGYFISIAPAFLLAVLQSPTTALYVVILYTGAHWANDFILIPLIQRRTIRLYPALTLSMQFLLWSLVGGIGLLAATPLLAALVVALHFVYLDQTPDLPANRK